MIRDDSLTRARIASATVDARGGQDVVVLDLRGHTLVTDYFVIATATSTVHLRALRDAVEQEMGVAGERLISREGTEGSGWVLLDFGDVIVHLLMEHTRAYYKLEKMWAKATPFTAKSL